MNTIHYRCLHCSKLPYKNRSTYTGFTRYLQLSNYFSISSGYSSCLVSYFLFSSQIFLFFGVTFIAFGLAGISLKWKQEWPTVPLSLLVQLGSLCEDLLL